MYKETCKRTKCIDFKIQKYSLSMTIQYHSDIAAVAWDIQMCAIPSHGGVSHGIPIGMTFLWTSLTIHQACTTRRAKFASDRRSLFHFDVEISL